MSANTYYEAHITMVGFPAFIKPQVDALKWKFSVIDGDPTLGIGLKCYATRHFKSSIAKEKVLQELHETAACLEGRLVEVIRKKIELVIYDNRSNTVRFTCKGGCAECHLDDRTET